MPSKYIPQAQLSTAQRNRRRQLWRAAKRKTKENKLKLNGKKQIQARGRRSSPAARRPSPPVVVHRPPVVLQPPPLVRVPPAASQEKDPQADIEALVSFFDNP